MLTEMHFHGGHNLSPYNYNKLIDFSECNHGDIAELKIEFLRKRLSAKTLNVIQEKCKSASNYIKDEINIIDDPKNKELQHNG